MTVWTDYGSMAAQVDSWAGKSPVGSCLNAGELADSLAFGDYSLEMLKTVLPVLSRYPGRELYLLTKSTGEVLDGLKPESFVTVGFSVNAEEVGAAYEKGAPLPSERLAGAKRLRDRGWRIKIRLDPMIPVDGWERAYGEGDSRFPSIQSFPAGVLPEERHMEIRFRTGIGRQAQN